ncbi:hypothetical protein [Ferrimicrobium acidiphilum]|uniref:PBP domain-containing protein n=1 Tax=Ferrimicrobium acidiphilum DSM 19497 TaxID=1121877 RepID=A0A0D8FYS0_9ACTN|nr:hypothetical protein [Ferrimicrobium acidiphilum]KJE77757.1 hypothetical protein FEAC_05050 [Ferrimicrobium acidiphilum DSM 19497]MCL5053301.1 hypothetical protein [Gammaproteobacteria bacterium]
MHLRRLSLGVLAALAPSLLAGCGTGSTATTGVTSTPSPSASKLSPVSLNGVIFTTMAATPLRQTFSSALSGLTANYPHLVARATYPTPQSMDLASLTAAANLYLFSVNPGTTLLGQLGGIKRVPISTSTLYLSANLGKSQAITLTSAVLVGILEGSITNWDNSLIAAANPHIVLPNLSLTINSFPTTGQRASIIDHELSVQPTSYGATDAAHCTTTPGCLDVSLTPPTTPPLAVDNGSGQPSLPGSAQYPLVTYELAIITTTPAHPRKEIAAVRITQTLIKDGNLSSTVRTSELAILRKLLEQLTIAHYANDPAPT